MLDIGHLFRSERSCGDTVGLATLVRCDGMGTIASMLEVGLQNTKWFSDAVAYMWNLNVNFHTNELGLCETLFSLLRTL